LTITAALLACIAVIVMVLVPSAQAGIVHPFVASFGPEGPGTAGLFASPQAVTVDQATGDVYVLDAGTGQVLKFNAAGEPAEFSALKSNVLDGAGTSGEPSGEDSTPQGAFSFDSFGGAQVAIDASASSPAKGYVYVTNSLNQVVDVFDATGKYVGEIDGLAASPQTGGESCGVATDPEGHVYVGYLQRHIDEYAPTDATPEHDAFVGQLENAGRVCSVAADGLGNVYARTWFQGPLTRFDSSELGVETPQGTEVDKSSSAVAVDPSSNDVFSDEGPQVAQFDHDGKRTGTSGGGVLSGSSFGVAVNGKTGDLYASDTGTGVVDRFGPGELIPEPVVTIQAPSNITSSSALFHGTVEPEGSDTHWHFEYSTDGEASWTSTGGGDAGSGTSPVPVSDEVTNLLPAQTVEVRLVASNVGGPATSTTETFKTVQLAPDVATEPAQDITPDHATLQATVNAHNQATTYFFEYGTSTAYGSSIPATKDAVAETSGGPNTAGAAEQAIYGLANATTYHYRVVAHNSAGTVHGADQTFTTTSPLPASEPRAGIPGTGFLPDNRGWEQVSPADKNGGGVLIDSARVRAAATETPELPMAATFGSLGTFADVHGTGVANEYMAIRNGTPGTSGWATHGITPPQQPLSLLGLFQFFETQWQDDLSPDLTQGIVDTWSPLTDDPNVKDVANLYRRDDLRTAGIGTYRLLTECLLCVGTPLPPINSGGQIPRVAGASADFSHILFESTEPLVAGATAGVPNLYEWANGTLRLAAILPNSACGTPPCPAAASTAGQDAGPGGFALRHSEHTISTDGSHIVFTDVSAGNGQSTGNLYIRIDGTSTVQVNASERTDCADHNPCSGTPEPDPNGPQPAAYQTASTDGSRVFFTTPEQLTNTPIGGNTALYMYDASGPTGHHLTLISVDNEPADPPNTVLGVMGASDDGHYVYFISAGQLVAGKPVLGANEGIYEWHDGTISYVGHLADNNATNDESNDIFPSFYGLTPMAARVTPDGRHLLFQSSTGAGLTGYDSNKHVELYLYDADSHRLQCASCRPDGSRAEGDALVTARTFSGAAATSSHLNQPMTTDGSKVFFTSSDALVPEDTNGKTDAYEFDSATGTVHLLSGGTDNGDSYFMDATPSGDDAFFVTRQPLVGWDTDQSYDLYDARVGGGLPQPVQVTECATGACHGQLVGPPPDSPAATGGISGAGNLPPSPPSGGTSKPLTDAQRLAKALKTCRKRRDKHRRVACERQARKRYRVHKSAEKRRHR
jgi:hypothetical protein